MGGLRLPRQRLDLGHLILTKLTIALACVCLVLWQIPILATVAHVATTEFNDAAASSTTLVSGSISTSAGELLLMLVNVNIGNVSSVGESGGGTFSSAAAADSGNSESSIWYLANASGGSHTYTITFGAASVYDSGYLMRVSGAATSSPLDTCASGTGTGTAPASGNFSTDASYFMAGVITAGNGGTVTPGSGWTKPTNGDSGVAIGAVEYKANPGTSTHNADGTITSSEWAAVGCAFKAAGAASATKPPCLLLGLAC